MKEHEDYYAEKPEERCGRWLDFEEMLLVVGSPHVFTKGHSHDEQTRESIAAAMKRRRKTSEQRKSIARSLKGKRKSGGHRKRIAETMKGRRVSDAARLKMADAASTRNIIIMPVKRTG